ncbi:hypothetical protein [Pseudobacteriovorax antillogorgiicola]|uniref:Uncharacterized protein n=1 Tax=Pseudobacteriovorax antillogorgiicola TaxID=1513793 RepID=A0A1Y6CRS1_9BACT|nr:hypothetical protein [Pseudobacteriovorax antillogorgiicola]TCS46384.1 hypothetical protein EDD56_12448 [Pseudobacteriovorax antillogorgiicola]SMF68651.1 hypothetical protein SAMN06296036_12448 [Pseudobacteriovorax antillogorgiicola]
MLRALMSFALWSIFTSQSLAAADSYGKKLDATMTLIQKKADHNDIKKAAQDLVDESQPILKKFAKKYNQCEEYLGVVLKVADKLTSMDLDKIEADYHQDKALPKAESRCYHAKDLLVHPATVVVLAKKKPSKDNYAKMTAELAELKAHLAAVTVNLEK